MWKMGETHSRGSPCVCFEAGKLSPAGVNPAAGISTIKCFFSSPKINIFSRFLLPHLLSMPICFRLFCCRLFFPCLSQVLTLHWIYFHSFSPTSCSCVTGLWPVTFRARNSFHAPLKTVYVQIVIKFGKYGYRVLRMDWDCRSEDSWYWMRLCLSVCFGLVLRIDCPQRMLIVYGCEPMFGVQIGTSLLNKNIYSSRDYEVTTPIKIVLCSEKSRYAISTQLM